jgi:hypothetical protein
LYVEPTATHSDALTHDTDERVAVGPGFGLGTTDHTPSHSIANVPVEELEVVRPTATHAEALTHDTDNNLSLLPTLGLGTTTAESTVAPVGVDRTTQPNTIAITATVARTDLRTIRKPFDWIDERPFAGQLRNIVATELSTAR